MCDKKGSRRGYNELWILFQANYSNKFRLEKKPKRIVCVPFSIPLSIYILDSVWRENIFNSLKYIYSRSSMKKKQFQTLKVYMLLKSIETKHIFYSLKYKWSWSVSIANIFNTLGNKYSINIKRELFQFIDGYIYLISIKSGLIKSSLTRCLLLFVEVSPEFA